MNYVYGVRGCEWERLDDAVTLVGKKGLFISESVLHGLATKEPAAQVPWFEQSAGELLRRWNPTNRNEEYSLDDLRLVVDLKPGRAKEEVNLYELRRVWGGPTLSQTNDWWCPMLWRLDTLEHDKLLCNLPEGWPQTFACPVSRERVYEFLYCRYDADKKC